MGLDAEIVYVVPLFNVVKIEVKFWYESYPCGASYVELLFIVFKVTFEI